ncbi:response regulator [Archangium violaceum]|uniref:hybrid sensor histidine kinase/response regulator n=1 Tax=Archangium violaceum TaxID=83451 RepID=UPI001951D362|nr:response regulator [Archangium violaceum]QRO01671.1 response regulator [Archangium violaceum]
MRPDPEHASRPIRVLLVEDDEDDYLLTREALEPVGPRRRMVLEWAQTCEQALAEMASGRHDVCLLDHRLGAITGLELLEQARRRGWRGPVILLTSQGDDALDHQAMEAGAADFLEKSQLTPTLLDRSIRYALQHARTMEELHRSHAGFRELIERLPDGIAVLDDEHLIYANPALLTLLGCSSPDELVGGRVAELEERFFHPEDLSKLLHGLREGAKSGQPVSPGEVRLVRKTGGVVPVEFAQAPVVFDGRPGLVRIVRDLTERKQMQARLMLSDRMASLGTLAAGIAHEINNPLAYTIATLGHVETEVLPRLGAHEDDLRKLIADAQLGAGRVRDIVRQLKLFSRADEDARPGPVEVHRVLETAIRMASNEIRHRARLVCDFSERLVVEANESRLGQVVVNLLVNAAQAIPEGQVDRNEIRVSSRPHAEGVMIEVRDTGSGIPAEHLDRLFEPFFTTKPVGVGTGLGLPICHGIVSGFGGRMEVESEVGKGSTFRVILRAATTEAPPPAPSHPAQESRTAPVAPEAPRRGRLLVVDDEPMLGVSIRRTLQREHDVVTLTSAREACARLLGGEHFDVILCDIMMPEMSGMELHQELEHRAPELARRMVFLTGGAFTPNARAFLERVGNPRVEKPFCAQELRELVQSLVTGSRG